jgi:LuxR family transcriptional regulator, maltose regulon positive regulatory protein
MDPLQSAVARNANLTIGVSHDPRITGNGGTARPPEAVRSNSDLPPQIVEAKLAAPRLRANAVPRPGIMDALDGLHEAPVALVAAPPGYGKTTIVRTWCAQREGALAWVTLDPGDNDPSRLWSYVATAADRLRNGLGRGALQRLMVSGASIEFAVDELMNALATFDQELVIVLDDLQEVTDNECLSSIDYALTRLPPSVHLVLITRTDPALELAALRAGGSLVELRGDSLAFTAEEAHALLVERGKIDLRADDIETLCRRTDGWPAALVLASVWLQRVDDPQRAVSEFGGEHRFVAEYLSEVVLGALDDGTRAFLLRASALGRFTAELCDDVLDRSDSASLLKKLERSNLLVTRLERGGSYRIHPLFTEFARFRLASEAPDSEREINRRAAQWFLDRGFLFEGIEHAFAAAEYGIAAKVLVENHNALIRNGRSRTLLRYIRALPGGLISEHPELAVAAAVATTVVGHGALERRRFLRLVRRAQVKAPGRVSRYVEASAAGARAMAIEPDIAGAVREGRHAVTLALAGEDESAVFALAVCAAALYFAGDLDEAWSMAMEAVEHPDIERRPAGHAMARVPLALVALDRGQLDEARIHAETAKSILGDIGSSRSWIGAEAAAALGSVNAAEGNLVQAEHELAHAERLFRDEVATVHHTWLLLLLARVHCRRGRLNAAESELASANAAIRELGEAGRLRALADDVEAEIAEAVAHASSGEMLDAPSAAELTVLRLLATDLTAREIADQLYLSPHTVRSHTRALYRKLGIRTRADAVARAARLGLLEETESHI